MPHISKKGVKRKTFLRISNDLVVMIAGLHSKREAKLLLNEILTPTERIMLAKRIAIIFMLKKNYSFETIWRTLKVSPSTVARFWKETKQHSYPTISRRIQQEKASQEFWNSLESSLLVGMPPLGPRQAKRLYHYKRLSTNSRYKQNLHQK